MEDLDIKYSFMTKQQRLSAIRKLYKSKQFIGTFWIIGAGSIGTILIFMLLKVFIINQNSIILIDKRPEVEAKIHKYFPDIQFVNQHIKEDNYKQIFSRVKKDDIIIDCSFDICTCDMFRLCEQLQCSYINSSIEDWTYKDVTDPIKYSLKHKHNELDQINKTFTTHKSNFIISMGCNPGNVSIWAKLGLVLINKQYNHEYKTFGELSQKLGVQVVHISEKDTQVTRKPKQPDEYCNTWSSLGESMYEEGLGPVEISWGTHEKTLPADIVNDPTTNNHFVILKRRGIDLKAISYTPISKKFIGMLIRHDESFTIGRQLSVYKDDKILYKPSVYYVYHPTDSTMMSIYELMENDLDYQTNTRLLTDDIITGRDELGLSFFLANGDIYWIGSLLHIEEAREIYENQYNEHINATGPQVIAGYLSGIIYLTDLINKGTYRGLMCPDDLPYEFILKYSLPFLGEFIMTKITDLNFTEKYSKYFGTTIKLDKGWQFNDFLIN